MPNFRESTGHWQAPLFSQKPCAPRRMAQGVWVARPRLQDALPSCDLLALDAWWQGCPLARPLPTCPPSPIPSSPAMQPTGDPVQHLIGSVDLQPVSRRRWLGTPSTACGTRAGRQRAALLSQHGCSDAEARCKPWLCRPSAFCCRAAAGAKQDKRWGRAGTQTQSLAKPCKRRGPSSPLLLRPGSIGFDQPADARPRCLQQAQRGARQQDWPSGCGAAGFFGCRKGLPVDCVQDRFGVDPGLLHSVFKRQSLPKAELSDSTGPELLAGRGRRPQERTHCGARVNLEAN